MDSGWAQAWIAGGAAAVAIVAAVMSAYQAREAGKQAVQAKRQADAAHGEVDPTFHIERRQAEGERIDCAVVCRNFNRHALAVHEVRIHHPTDIVLIPEASTVRDAVANAISEMALDQDDLTVIKPRALLQGVMPGGEASEYRAPFRTAGAARISSENRHALQFYDVEAGRMIDLTYEVEFELLDGQSNARTFTGRATLRF